MQVPGVYWSGPRWMRPEQFFGPPMTRTIDINYFLSTLLKHFSSPNVDVDVINLPHIYFAAYKNAADVPRYAPHDLHHHPPGLR